MGHPHNLLGEPPATLLPANPEADEILVRQHGVIASFSRALAEGLSFQQTDEEFHATLDATIAEIYAASNT